ncbi:hypothetical protein SAMN04488574_14724 [Bacillus sp. 71mf]|nr:hypothetical protein SAMN04488574_14724 [Bacillus sp. 71mf]SFT22562.1 hypothetical protein SAMN04488145_1256 [Bacillus sp. 103mf]
MHKNRKIEKSLISSQNRYAFLHLKIVSKLESSILLRCIMGGYLFVSSISIFDFEGRFHTLPLLTMILIALFSFSLIRIDIRGGKINVLDSVIIVTTTLFIILRLIRDIPQIDTLSLLYATLIALLFFRVLRGKKSNVLDSVIIVTTTLFIIVQLIRDIPQSNSVHHILSMLF